MSKRIIKFTDNKIYYTIDNFVSLSQTNFPMNEVSFKSDGPYSNFYWEIEIVYYDKETKSLRITVTNFTCVDNDLFNKQESKDTVNKLVFEELDWYKLEPFLSSYTRKSLWHLISEKSKAEYDKRITLHNDFYKEIKFEGSQNAIELDDNQIPSKPRIYNKEFRFLLTNVNFSNGYASILYKFDFYESRIELKLYNSNIIPEHNHVKKFFHKIFRKKTVTINAEITIDQDDQITVKANSSDIDAIDEDFIRKIRQKEIQNAIERDYNTITKKCLFTADDFLSKDQDGNIFNQTAQDIVKYVIDKKDVRNKRQLEFLSGFDLTEKILLTPKPHFGFLFLIKGSNKLHYCWELLNSHATYVWRFKDQDDVDEQLNRIEGEISFIQLNGRNDYKNAKNRELDGNFQFHLLNHIKIQSETEDSFNKWEGDLLELIE